MHQSTDSSEIISNKKAGEIALPFNEDQFKNFIVGLLGKPQTISKRFRGNFEVTKDNLISLYKVLHQRIEQQKRFKTNSV